MQASTRNLAIPVLLAALFFGGKAAAYQKIEVPGTPPAKLSDLQKYMMLQVRRGLTENIAFGPVRLKGRAQDILSQGNFFEVEMTLKPFEFQDLNIERMEILIKQFRVDRDALLRWDLKVVDYREAQTRLIFSLKSLEKKMGGKQPELRLAADSAARIVEIRGHGRFCFIPSSYETRAALRWDEKSRKLYLAPKSVSWAGIKVPRGLWWMGRGECPSEPILDLSKSWIPLNIQEIYVGWDRVNLSTNW